MSHGGEGVVVGGVPLSLYILPEVLYYLLLGEYILPVQLQEGNEWLRPGRAERRAAKLKTAETVARLLYLGMNELFVQSEGCIEALFYGSCQSR